MDALDHALVQLCAWAPFWSGRMCRANSRFLCHEAILPIKHITMGRLLTWCDAAESPAPRNWNNTCNVRFIQEHVTYIQNIHWGYVQRLPNSNMRNSARSQFFGTATGTDVRDRDPLERGSLQKYLYVTEPHATAGKSIPNK